MPKSLFSPLWYRVESITPRLRSHVEIHRHHYRDELWYVLQDKISGRYHRFTPAAYYLIDQMDGERTLRRIWEDAVAQLGDDAPTQDETIQLLGQLHATDLLATNVIPNSTELFERHRKQARLKLRQQLLSPLAVRIPLFDPEPLLARFKSWVTPLFGWIGGLLWLVVVGYGLSLAAIHWPELTSNIADTVLTPANLLLVWLLFPFVKALHELGHGFATKIWGGEVHEIGIMFLVFMPVPYVDASAASAFRERYKRAIVGAAGMLVEFFVACIAMVIWVNAEQGIVRSMAYNVILIAGVSTLLFNANPLLRYDGYYILTDLLEIPNLGMRSNQFLGYLVQRYAFGAKQVDSPATTPGEARWMFFYSIASFFYRAFIMIAISLFVATKLFFIGVLLAIWAFASVFLIPIVKGIYSLTTSPRLHRSRSRAMSITLGTVGAIVVVLFFFPAPLWTNAEGVVWLPENSIVRAGTACTIEKILFKTDSYVNKGDALIDCREESLVAEMEVLTARERELEIRQVQEMRRDRFQAAIAGAELDKVRADLARARERVADLVILSPADGRLRIPLEEDLPGRYVFKGDILAYVIQPGPVTARVVVTQSDVERVRNRTQRVEVLALGDGLVALEGRIEREVPGASELLPSAALGNRGGGRIAVDPRKPEGTTAFQKIFQFDVALPDSYRPGEFGSRVHVRMYHGVEPIAVQVFWAVREVFLARFGV